MEQERERENAAESSPSESPPFFSTDFFPNDVVVVFGRERLLVAAGVAPLSLGSYAGVTL